AELERGIERDRRLRRRSSDTDDDGFFRAIAEQTLSAGGVDHPQGPETHDAVQHSGQNGLHGRSSVAPKTYFMPPLLGFRHSSHTLLNRRADNPYDQRMLELG